jgi:probable rRNA maturation factor
MAVTISCRAPAARPWLRYVRDRGARILRLLGRARDELSVSLVDDAEMRALNAAYRGRDRPTDVLAFALTEEAVADAPIAPLPGRPSRGRILGDVVISIDTAVMQARADRCALPVRLDALLIHGMLHLVGYDHERSAAEERRMRRKEREVRAGLPRPGVAAPRTRGSARVRASRPRAAGPRR